MKEANIKNDKGVKGNYLFDKTLFYDPGVNCRKTKSKEN
jgi:hypothetical protein